MYYHYRPYAVSIGILPFIYPKFKKKHKPLNRLGSLECPYCRKVILGFLIIIRI